MKEIKNNFVLLRLADRHCHTLLLEEIDEKNADR